ncbi:MAG: putative thiamine-phosphate synthase [Candidatus Tectimicrobiota bacterium]|nr:MAG: putative thiamine-phosphate synthase [Candidatus Tectomicrobia bacterium]
MPVPFRLYVVTDRQQTGGRPLEEVVAAAARGGAGAVQLREKDLLAAELYGLGQRLQEALAPWGVPLLVNDRLDVALALDAAGVHLAGHSLPPAVARRLLGPPKLLGVSTHHLEEARQAEAAGADFVVFGPVFATPSKLAYGPPQGLHALAAVVRQLTIPVFAIGGIDATNVAQVLETGAYGVAVIRAVLAAPDPAAAAQALATALRRR